MKNNIYVNPQYDPNSVISISTVGYGLSPISFSSKYHIRDRWVFHYIESGVCLYEFNGKIYEISQGGVFIIFPNTTVKYQAHIGESYSATYVDFGGEKAEQYISKIGFSYDNPVIADVDSEFAEVLKNLVFIKEELSERISDFKLTAGLFECFAYLESAAEKEQSLRRNTNMYVKSAIIYMKSLYYNGITISDVADYLNIDRSYFFKLFKKYVGISPQRYLIDMRIEKAKEYLKSGKKVRETAECVGIDDTLYFSRLFKKRVGISPTEYKNIFYDNL